MAPCWHRILAVISLSVVGCTTTAPPDDIKTAPSGMIFGYVEANNEAIEQVDIFEYGQVYMPPLRRPPRVLVFDNGVFMAENLKPGKYIIAGFRSEKNNYTMARSARQMYQRILQLKPGEILYAGAFQLLITQRGKFDYGNFEVNQLQRPGERDVLKHLYDVTSSTGWQNKIERRLKELWQ
ncbi:MAG: hypothetical protein HY080_11090 [Gammaproteobacteria bacterium]|nr:hypothetical protein [Gammaproteobacteria bacterium]